MAKTGRKNNGDLVARRRAIISDLYLKGYYQSDIARQVNVSQQQISKDLAVIRKQWKESAIRNYDEALDQELARINKREIEAWEAWEKSKEQFRQRTIKGRAIGDSETNIVEKSETTEERYGDARLLSLVEACSKQRCDLLGLNKAPIEKPKEVNVNLSGLTTEQLLVLAQIKQKVNAG